MARPHTPKNIKLYPPEYIVPFIFHLYLCTEDWNLKIFAKEILRRLILEL